MIPEVSVSISAKGTRDVVGAAEHHLHAVDVAEHEVAIGDAADGGDDDPLRGQLEVDRALGQHAVLELERAAVVRDDVGQDPLDLGPRRFGQLALVDEAGVGQDLGQRAARPDLAVHVLELLGGDLAAFDQDRAELVAGIVGGSEKDPARPEVEGFLVRGTRHLEGAGGPVTVEVDQQEREGGRVDRPAVGDVSHRPSGHPEMDGSSVRSTYYHGSLTAPGTPG